VHIGDYPPLLEALVLLADGFTVMVNAF